MTLDASWQASRTSVTVSPKDWRRSGRMFST
jgi:hypothetical protein